MDIEKLNKSQIVLLTLLVSFVTSIATGIVTVSLMDQAPPAIAQTVNRVIERTVEKMVPAAGQPAAAATTVVTTEKTVVVKESDLIAAAIERVHPSLVHVYTSASENAAFLGMGIILDDSGSVIVDASSLGETTEPVLVLEDGSRVHSYVSWKHIGAGTAMLRAATTTIDGVALKFTPAKLAVTRPTLGQSVVALSGKSIPRIADGLVSAVIPLALGGIDVVDTNISEDLIMPGSPLINTDGSIVGISTSVSRASSEGGFVSSSSLVSQHSEAE